MIPALAMETVCCSCEIKETKVSRAISSKEEEERERLTMTSCKTLRVASDILSNSSIQQTPPSERTRAPLRKGEREERRNEFSLSLKEGKK